MSRAVGTTVQFTLDTEWTGKTATSTLLEFYTEDYADTMSLAVFLISLAVSVYFAEPIRAVIPINLLLLLILVHIVYVLIRWYVKGCMRSRGYY